MQRVLITGGTGFVGPHLLRFLANFEVAITVVSTSDPNSPEKSATYCRADVRDEKEIGSLIRSVKPEYIYHFAAVSSVAASWANPRETFEINVLGSYNIFEAAMRLPDPPRILFASTSQVYRPSDGALSELSSLSPDNPYASSKAMAELLRVQYGHLARGGILVARAFNHTGPGQSPAFAISSFAKQLAEIEAGLRSPVIKVGNLEVHRDFTDVRDVVAAYYALLQNGRCGEIYNICTGRSLRLSDIVDVLRKSCRVPVAIEIEPALLRRADAPVTLGDPQKIQEETGWAPRIPFATTLHDLLTYWRATVKSVEPRTCS